MKCGCYPVGLTKIWVNLKTSGILSFTLGVYCYNCKSKGQVLMLVNKRGVSCQRVEAKQCCRSPLLEFSEFRARLLHKGDRVRIPLQDVTFAPERGRGSAWQDWQRTFEPVTGQPCFINQSTGEMTWHMPALGPSSSRGLPSAGLLPVIPMENKWVALPGAEHDYYRYAQNQYGDRSVRVERLIGSRNDSVEVQIMDEDDQSYAYLTRQSTVTKCSRCGHAIDRESGCDNMTCQCGNNFIFFNAAF
mmetsp:Transcript_81440/g.144239  ORF Transcript_81440/g.144239 Transcript_81440/m.144239 type:complete len:246 (+) Transcript_81440:3-740(+)